MDDCWEKIFQYLDVPDLANAELVSSLWRHIIHQRHIWDKLARQKFSSFPLWRQIALWKPSNGVLPKYDKATCLLYYQICKKLYDNWSNGLFVKRILEHKGAYIFTLNGGHIITAGVDGDIHTVKVWSRKDLHCEQVWVEVSTRLWTVMACNDEILVTSLWDAVSVKSVILIRALDSGRAVCQIVEPFVVVDVRWGHGWLLIQSEHVKQEDQCKIAALRIEDIQRGDAFQRKVVWSSDGDKTDKEEVWMDFNSRHLALLHCFNGSRIGNRFDVYATANLQRLGSFEIPPDAAEEDFRLVRPGVLMTTSRDRLWLWDLETGRCMREFSNIFRRNDGNDSHETAGINERFLIAEGTEPGTLSIWNADSLLNPLHQADPHLHPVVTCRLEGQSVIDDFLADDLGIVGWESSTHSDRIWTMEFLPLDMFLHNRNSGLTAGRNAEPSSKKKSRLALILGRVTDWMAASIADFICQAIQQLFIP